MNAFLLTVTPQLSWTSYRPLQSCSIYCKSSIYCIHAANILQECFTRAVDLQYHTANAVYTANMLPFILQKCCIDITHWAKYCISSIYCKYTANILQIYCKNIHKIVFQIHTAIMLSSCLMMQHIDAYQFFTVGMM